MMLPISGGKEPLECLEIKLGEQCADGEEEGENEELVLHVLKGEDGDRGIPRLAVPLNGRGDAAEASHVLAEAPFESVAFKATHDVDEGGGGNMFFEPRGTFVFAFTWGRRNRSSLDLA